MPSVRCRFFDEEGNPVHGGCYRGDNCDFVHPNDPQWSSARIRVDRPGPRGRGRGTGRGGGHPSGGASSSQTWGFDTWGKSTTTHGNQPSTGYTSTNLGDTVKTWGEPSTTWGAQSATWGDQSRTSGDATTAAPGGSPTRQWGGTTTETRGGSPTMTWGDATTTWGNATTTWGGAATWGGTTSAEPWWDTNVTRETQPAAREVSPIAQLDAATMSGDQTKPGGDARTAGSRGDPPVWGNTTTAWGGHPYAWGDQPSTRRDTAIVSADQMTPGGDATAARSGGEPTWGGQPTASGDQAIARRDATDISAHQITPGGDATTTSSGGESAVWAKTPTLGAQETSMGDLMTRTPWTDATPTARAGKAPAPLHTDTMDYTAISRASTPDSIDTTVQCRSFTSTSPKDLSPPDRDRLWKEYIDTIIKAVRTMVNLETAQKELAQFEPVHRHRTILRVGEAAKRRLDSTRKHLDRRVSEYQQKSDQLIDILTKMQAKYQFGEIEEYWEFDPEELVHYKMSLEEWAVSAHAFTETLAMRKQQDAPRILSPTPSPASTLEEGQIPESVSSSPPPERRCQSTEPTSPSGLEERLRQVEHAMENLEDRVEGWPFPLIDETTESLLSKRKTDLAVKPRTPPPPQSGDWERRLDVATSHLEGIQLQITAISEEVGMIDRDGNRRAITVWREKTQQNDSSSSQRHSQREKNHETAQEIDAKLNAFSSRFDDYLKMAPPQPPANPSPIPDLKNLRREISASILKDIEMAHRESLANAKRELSKTEQMILMGFKKKMEPFLQL